MAPTLHGLLREIIEKHGLTPQQAREKRGYRAVRARQEYCYRALTETTHSARVISRLVNLDASTVLYGAGRYAREWKLPYPRNANYDDWQKWTDWRTWPSHASA